MLCHELVRLARTTQGDPSLDIDLPVLDVDAALNLQRSSPLIASVLDTHGTGPYGLALARGVAARLSDPSGDPLRAALTAACVSVATSERVAAAIRAGTLAAQRLLDRLEMSHLDHWQAVGTGGVTGSAVAAAVALDADDEQLATAIALSASQVTGHRVWSGREHQALIVGRAAAAGVLSAVLATSGFTASTAALDGHDGLLSAMMAS